MHTYMWLVIDARDYACDSQTNWTGVLLTWHSDQYPVWGTTVSLCEILEIGKPDKLLTKRYQVQFWFREGTSSTVAFVKAVRQHRDKYAERETETERRPKQWDNRGNGDKVCLPLTGELLTHKTDMCIIKCHICQTFRFSSLHSWHSWDWLRNKTLSNPTLACCWYSSHASEASP